MNIPQEVKIGAITYKVEVVDSIINKNDALGHTSWQRETIQILKGKPDYMFNTFLHEVVHTFNIIENETANQNMADRLFEFIKNNPNVFSMKGERR